MLRMRLTPELVEPTVEQYSLADINLDVGEWLRVNARFVGAVDEAEF
jgi:hypothetical protein